MLEFLSQKLTDFKIWLLSLWTDFQEFISYLFIETTDLILSAFASIIEAIPVPSFIQNNGLQTAINAISPDILYFVSMSGLSNAMGILSAGLAFRMLRKFVTLFQW